MKSSKTIVARMHKVDRRTADYGVAEPSMARPSLLAEAAEFPDHDGRSSCSKPRGLLSGRLDRLAAWSWGRTGRAVAVHRAIIHRWKTIVAWMPAGATGIDRVEVGPLDLTA